MVVRDEDVAEPRKRDTRQHQLPRDPSPQSTT